MTETGFYAMGAWGTEPARVAAIARHLPDAVVYVYGRSNVRNLFAWHGVTTVVPTCPNPGCSGLSPRDLDTWLRLRHPDRLVMDAYPYGVLYREARDYITARQDPTFYLYRRNTTDLDYQTQDFSAVLKVDPSESAGVDLHPVLPFDADELPSRSDARVSLGASDRPIVLIIGEGTTPEINQFVIRHCTLAGFDHVVVVNQYPVMPLMVGADLVVGYAGYSQTEAAAVGVPMAAVTNRSDSGQSWRANTTAPQLAATIAALDVRAPEPVTFRNYSRRAAALIAGQQGWETVDG